MGSIEGNNGPDRRKPGGLRRIRSDRNSELHQYVAMSACGERKCVPDVGTEPAQGDIDHLCQVWAEVGRAILLRRVLFNEQEDLAQ